jgi:apolipoprotein N-acyltransferase
MSADSQLDKMLHLTEQYIDSQTQFVIFPETALQGGLDEDHLDQSPLLLKLKAFLKVYPNLSILTGADSYRFYYNSAQKTETARPYNEGLYYDSYNAAYFLNNVDSFQTYHKAKLVPGVEKMPYPSIFGFLEKMAIDLGGTSGSLASDTESKNFFNYHKIALAPIICYESVFGEFVASYVSKGAGILCIITNDGWWGNTAGYKQHFDYARLRAIETRRYIARSANTGISGFIDDEGKILAKSNWWVEAGLKMSLPVNTEETFYVKYGDYIAIIALLLALSEFLRLFVKVKKYNT